MQMSMCPYFVSASKGWNACSVYASFPGGAISPSSYFRPIKAGDRGHGLRWIIDHREPGERGWGEIPTGYGQAGHHPSRWRVLGGSAIWPRWGRYTRDGSLLEEKTRFGLQGQKPVVEPCPEHSGESVIYGEKSSIYPRQGGVQSSVRRKLSRRGESPGEHAEFAFSYPSSSATSMNRKEKQYGGSRFDSAGMGCVDLLILLPLRHPDVSSRQRYAFYLLFGNISLAPVVWDASHALTRAYSTCVVLSSRTLEEVPRLPGPVAPWHPVVLAKFDVTPQELWVFAWSSMLPRLPGAGLGLTLSRKKKWGLTNRTPLSTLYSSFASLGPALQIRFRREKKKGESKNQAVSNFQW